MRKFIVYICSLICCLISLECGGPIASSAYVYRVINDDCNCSEYKTSDRRNKIEYLFRGHFNVDPGIVTTIEVEFTNNSNDTLRLGLGTAKVSSRNISYQYNDKFLPLPAIDILPNHSDIIQLTGTSLEMKENWHKIAGERLTLTLQGLRLGGKTVLPSTTVVFIPENPKLGR